MYVAIELGGERRELMFNMYALEEYTKRMLNDLNAAIAANPNVSVEDVKVSQASLVYACIYSGLLGNAYAEGNINKLGFTFKDVITWVDAAKNEDLEAACNCLSETERYKENLKNLEGAVSSLNESAKKKVSRKPTKKNGS